MLVSSSNLTFEKWFGSVAYIPNSFASEYICDEDTSEEPKRALKLVSRNSSSSTGKEENDEIHEESFNMIRYRAGITRAKWAMDDEHFLVASELGHIELFKIAVNTERANNENEAKSDACNGVVDGCGEISNGKQESGVENIRFDSLMYVREHDSLIDCLETRVDDAVAITGSHDCKLIEHE